MIEKALYHMGHMAHIEKTATNLMKKYAPLAITGGVGIGVGVAIGKADKEKLLKKKYNKGYEDASKIYENKFKNQTEEFLAKVKDIEKNTMEYDQLIQDYEKEIIDLEEKLQKSEEELETLRFLKKQKDELINLKAAI